MRMINNGFVANGESYFQVIAVMLRAPRNGQNATYEEMALVGPVLRRLNTLGPNSEAGLLLEEAEWSELCDRVKSPAANFTQNDPTVLDFCQAVIEAQPVDLTRKDAATGLSPEDSFHRLRDGTFDNP